MGSNERMRFLDELEKKHAFTKNEYRLSPTVHFVTDCNSMHQKLSCWYSSLTHSIDFTFLNTFTSKRSAHVFVLLLAYYQRAKESKTVKQDDVIDYAGLCPYLYKNYSTQDLLLHKNH